MTLDELMARLREGGVALGAGLSEAERLRDEVAELPRVIVDPRLIVEAESNAALRAQHHDVPTELGYIQEMLRMDADGLWFVDYLTAGETEMESPLEYLEFLEQHGRLVERRIESAAVLDRAARAWTWLWSYHNRIIDECFERRRIDETTRARLRLPAHGPLIYVFPPSAKAPD